MLHRLKLPSINQLDALTLDAGIIQGTLVFVDTDGAFERGGLNLFKSDDTPQAQYTLSRNAVPNAVFAGRVIMSVNQHI